MDDLSIPIGGFKKNSAFAGIIFNVTYSSSAKHKTDSENGTIVLVEITNGEITVGDTIIMRGINGVIKDKVISIEKDGQRCPLGKSPDRIGICIKRSRVSDLVE